MTKLNPQLMLSLIKPFRSLPPFSEIKSRDLQTVTLLLFMLESRTLIEAALKESLKLSKKK